MHQHSIGLLITLHMCVKVANLTELVIRPGRNVWRSYYARTRVRLAYNIQYDILNVLSIRLPRYYVIFIDNSICY